MSAKTRGFLLVMTLLAVFAGNVRMGVAAEDGAIEDPAGDAWSGELHPLLRRLPSEVTLPGAVSYGPADIRKVWFTTDYVTETDEGGVTHRPTGISLHVDTEEPFDATGPMVSFKINMHFRSGCIGYLIAELGGGAVWTRTTQDGVRWEIYDACGRELDPNELPNEITVYEDARWEIAKSEGGFTASIPYDTLLPWQRDLIAPGAVVENFDADSHVEIGIYPTVDVTESATFTFGQNLP